jgi:HPt (histidine-containing phosphotransfer) domain-containing protein
MSEPPLDTAVLDRLRAAMGDSGVDLVGELIDLFAQEGPAFLAALREAAQAGELEAARRKAHDLKGSSANLGASRLKELCHGLEAAARAGDLATIRDRLPGVAEELERVLAALSEQRRAS